MKTWYEGDWGINFFSLSSCTGLAPNSTCYRVTFGVVVKKKKKLGINFMCFCMRPISPVLFSSFYSLQHQSCQLVLTLIVLLSSLMSDQAGSSSG